MNVSCPNCGITVGEQIGGKLGVGLAAAYFGRRISPIASILFGILGAMVGHHLIDAEIRRCPQCGNVFRIINQLPL